MTYGPKVCCPPSGRNVTCGGGEGRRGQHVIKLSPSPPPPLSFVLFQMWPRFELSSSVIAAPGHRACAVMIPSTANLQPFARPWARCKSNPRRKGFLPTAGSIVHINHNIRDGPMSSDSTIICIWFRFNVEKEKKIKVDSATAVRPQRAV